MQNRSTPRGAYQAVASVAAASLHSACAGTHDAGKPLRRSSRQRVSHPDSVPANELTS